MNNFTWKRERLNIKNIKSWYIKSPKSVPEAYLLDNIIFPDPFRQNKDSIWKYACKIKLWNKRNTNGIVNQVKP